MVLGYSYTAIVKIRQGDSYKMAVNQFGLKYYDYDNNLSLLYSDVFSKVKSLFQEYNLSEEDIDYFQIIFR